METPIRIFSDLHLAHPASRIHDVEMFRALIEGAGTVVFNGDTFESRNKLLRHEGEKGFDRLRKLCSECGAAVVFLRGNHDPEIDGPQFLDLELGSVFITHGDVLFPTISPWNPKVLPLQSEMLKIHAKKNPECNLEEELDATDQCRLLVEAVEKPRNKGRFWKIQAASRLIWPPRRLFEMIRCWVVAPKRALNFQKRHRPESRFIIIGHTHRCFIKKQGDHTVINTGGFLSVGAAQFVEIDHGRLSVYQVDESGGTFTPGKQRVFFRLLICERVMKVALLIY